MPTAMIRRSFFQALAAALLPEPLHSAAKSVQPGCQPFARTLQHPAPVHDPDWLREWREIRKLEVFAKDLPEHDDPHQWAIAAANTTSDIAFSRRFCRDRPNLERRAGAWLRDFNAKAARPEFSISGHLSESKGFGNLV
jgi:hypothetical protein